MQLIQISIADSESSLFWHWSSLTGPDNVTFNVIRKKAVSTVHSVFVIESSRLSRPVKKDVQCGLIMFWWHTG